MNIDEITIGQAKQIAALVSASNQTKSAIEYNDFWKLGDTYLIRTVTMIDTGVLVSLDQHEIILKDAAWIPDTGIRFSDALKKNEFGEVEPFPDGLVAIGRGSIIDAVRISAAPRVQL